jgi:hypothetical protein
MWFAGHFPRTRVFSDTFDAGAATTVTGKNSARKRAGEAKGTAPDIAVSMTQW